MAGRLSERVPSERLPFLVSTAPGPPLAATWRGGLPLRRLCGVAVVAAAAVALLSSPSRPKPWRSALGDDDLGLALLGRARGAGVATRLDAVMSGKPSAPMAAPACIGLEVCPPYPMPYPHGQWPESYDYEGEFPEGFLWGMGTASYQIEGAYRSGGRGASIWDTHVGADTSGMPGSNCSYCCEAPPCPVHWGMGARGATGNVACDHYNIWRTDVALMKSMGLKAYRFSLSWPRLIPTGKLRDGVNEEGVAFYSELIDALLAAGVSPVVTLYHWDLPQALLDPPNEMAWWSVDEGGHPDAKILEDWLDYVNLCFARFGDRVNTWVTFNEPWTFVFLGSGRGMAPSIPETGNLTTDAWIAAHNLLIAHAEAVALYRGKFRATQKGSIGITNNMDWCEPASEDPADTGASERCLLFALGWLADPIFGATGDYPPAMRALYGRRLPEFTLRQRELLRGSSDFFGLNHYGTSWIRNNLSNPGETLTYATGDAHGLPVAASSWLHGAGWGLRKLVNWVSRRYGNPPIIMTEGGWSAPADVSASEASKDRMRTLYYANYTSELRKAIFDDGVDVRGYFAWSLMDNFEWNAGYSVRFGTTYVDYSYGFDPNAAVNQQRQPTAGRQWRRRKESSCWLEVVWRSQRLVDPGSDAFEGCVDSSVFQGTFVDSRIPGCAMTIELDSSAGSANITYSEVSGEGSCNGDGSVVAVDTAVVSGGTIVADVPRVGSRGLLQGFWRKVGSAIEWSDGGTWSQVDLVP